ncbi:hypothetical protein [Clostridium estertheticum]|uniref:Uncharacterized protein n=2 Tax=Clostridium estertheticum TaxID=238834 RepID=A0A1J0GGD0_9CLOT|nr:hypothetical protein [Clostridium estertheticum]APC40335.1 hypothetical protein A7L45_09795 [Clostridium estertheticum subsp. estertheticum]MBU3174285.1 hypothetical protein [Clostridium estertheticum]MBZ9617848.1 hypothetical protein [Clostridium estertheticum subsp. laramiense]MCB2343280.1 hypothetical protein [Clostridium estertheticum]MPQ31654.1 hypothetical protein [Clostridium estertheticum]
MQLLKGVLDSTKVEKSNLYEAIIFTIIGIVVMFVMEFLCNSIAKKIAFKEFLRRLKLTCEEVKGLVDKKPKLKGWFM